MNFDFCQKKIAHLTGMRTETGAYFKQEITVVKSPKPSRMHFCRNRTMEVLPWSVTMENRLYDMGQIHGPSYKQPPRGLISKRL